MKTENNFFNDLELPIDHKDSSLFKGRDKVISVAENQLFNLKKRLIFLIGENGIGKTSFGNVVRFKTKSLTNKDEFSFDSNWSLQSFISELFKSISKSIDFFKERNLVSENKILEGFKLKYNKDITVSFKQESKKEKISLKDMIKDLLILSEEIKKINKEEYSIIIQLDDFVLNKDDNKKKFLSFYKDLSALFSLDFISWIVITSDEMMDLLKEEKMIDKEISFSLKLEKLTFEEVKQVLSVRIKNFSMNDEYLFTLFNSVNGKFKLILKYIGSLIKYNKNNPKLSDGVIQSYFLEFFQKKEFTPKELEMFVFIKKNPGLKFSDIKKHFDVDKAVISRRLSSMVSENLIVLSSDDKYYVHIDAFFYEL